MPGEAPSIQYGTPQASILRGRWDAGIVLMLWVARRASWALLFIGAALAVARGDLAAASELDTIEEVLRAVLSPLAPLALAFIFRLVVVGVAFLSAYPVGVREAKEVPGDLDGGALRRLSTVWRVTTAHRSRRWTWPVRNLAVERTGGVGRALDLTDRTFAVLTILAAVALLVVIFLEA